MIAPVDHKLPLAEDDVKFTDPPSQKVVEPLGVTTGVAGIGFTVTFVIVEVAEQPLPSVYVTEYVPDVVTEIICVVSPVDQRFPVA